MQDSQTAHLTWSLHTSGNVNLWPELCQRNQVKHCARKRETRENSEAVKLDDSEYPKLGSKSIRNKNSARVNKSSTIQVLIPAQMNMEPKRSKRYKRPDKICINLQEALESTRCMNKTNNKDSPQLRINIYNGISGLTEKNNSNVRKINICISKLKKPSKLKKIILLNRHLKAHINIQRRDAFERAKMEAICKDVNAIDFSALNIRADPETDVNYVKDMSAMTLYSKDYRDVNKETISEDTVYYRPDVIEQMNNLQIQRQCIAKKLPEVIVTSNFPRTDNNAIDNDIVQQTLSLEIKEDIKQEIQTTIKTENSGSIVHSRNFREYCTNILTPGLNNSLEKFLLEITRIQKRFHEKNPNKSRYKRRYYCGLKEVQKQAELRRLKYVIIAPDLEKVELEDGLDDRVEKLLEICRRQDIVFCFGLSRRKLGYTTYGKRLVACVGISNYTGTEELFKDVLTELVQAREEFKKLSGGTEVGINVSKLTAEDYLPSETVRTLLKILSPVI